MSSVRGADERDDSPGRAQTKRARTDGARSDWRRTLQLSLAAIWLLDGILQLQPFFFTPGRAGFSGMLAGAASDNPGWLAHTIAWNASVVDHHALATNAAFASIQVLLALGIACRPTLKVALGASVLWSLFVWWFGEGLGGVFGGAGSPIAGGPGAVLFYAFLAVLLWPSERTGSSPPFAAANAIGVASAKVTWAVVWTLLALLMIGQGRSPQGVSSEITSVEPGEPGWLTTVDHHAASLVDHQGLLVSLVFTVIFLLIATAVFLPEQIGRSVLVLAIVTSSLIWIVGQNFGMILPGGATDPNSGPLLILLVLSYWPRHPSVAHEAAGRPAVIEPRLTMEIA
jgi:hypothetical protein